MIFPSGNQGCGRIAVVGVQAENDHIFLSVMPIIPSGPPLIFYCAIGYRYLSGTKERKTSKTGNR